MSTKKIEKKLTLNKETVARLTGIDMKGIQGGIVETGCVTICCDTIKYCNTVVVC